MHGAGVDDVVAEAIFSNKRKTIQLNVLRGAKIQAAVGVTELCDGNAHQV